MIDRSEQDYIAVRIGDENEHNQTSVTILNLPGHRAGTLCTIYNKYICESISIPVHIL
jgi:hypothetical protein